MRNIKFENGSSYAISNRGVDSRTILISKEDYDRFETYLYILNDAENPRPANFFLRKHRPTDITEHKRMDPLVAIGAYVLLPDSFELILTPLKENGIASFMQKLSTAYSMYFNDKYQRTGRLFEGTYKARRLDDEQQFKTSIAHVHLSPAKLFRHDLQHASMPEIESIAGSLMQYRYSSIGEYVSGKFAILSSKDFPKYLRRANHIDTYIHYWFRKKGITHEKDQHDSIE